MKKLRIAHFTAYLPKACGIATYALSIRKTIVDRGVDIEDWVVAISDKPEGYNYRSDVRYSFWDNDKDGYKKAADIINNSDVDVVNIQHEFGLYGSKVNPSTIGKDDGENFLLFLRELKKPTVTASTVDAVIIVSTFKLTINSV